MAVNAAAEAELGLLHAKIAKVMSKSLDTYAKAQDAFLKLVEDGVDAESILEYPEVSPALLAVITKFLSDNKITAAPAENNETSELGKKLADRQERRNARNVVPFPSAHSV